MEYLEPHSMTADAVVEHARLWGLAQGRGPILQGRAAQQFRAMSLFRNAGQSSAIFVQDLIQETLAGVFRHQYPAAKFASGELITIVEGGNRGAVAFGWNALDRTGVEPKSGLVNDRGDNIQSVTLTGAGKIQQIHTVARSIDWTIQDLDTAAMNGAFDLIAEKKAALREQLDEDLDSYIGDGVPELDWPSIYALPGAFLNVAALNGGWLSLTAADNPKIVADVLSAQNTQRMETIGVEGATDAIVSMNLWARLMSPYSEFGGPSVLDQIKASVPEIKTWNWERHLPAGQLFLYRNDPNYVAAKAPLRFDFLPPQATAMSFTVICRNRFGGVYSRRPRSMMMLTGL